MRYFKKKCDYTIEETEKYIPVNCMVFYTLNDIVEIIHKITIPDVSKIIVSFLDEILDLSDDSCPFCERSFDSLENKFPYIKPIIYNPSKDLPSPSLCYNSYRALLTPINNNLGYNLIEEPTSDEECDPYPRIDTTKLYHKKHIELNDSTPKYICYHGFNAKPNKFKNTVYHNECYKKLITTKLANKKNTKCNGCNNNFM